MTSSPRKLTAILAADVAGYSRLMGSDEEGTLARLKAHRREMIDPAIAEHRGRIVKTTGDGLLAEFASVVDAVRCAVEIQKAMREREADLAADQLLRFRIGVNLGDVIVDGDDIHGDGVNVAARLEALAEPGTICLSAAAWDQVRGKVAVAAEDLGEKKLKNIERAIRVYLIAPDAAPAERAALPLPDKPSIAVLPFQNMSGDPEQEYFADGMVEEIITALSRFHWLFVIARNSSFTYKGRAVDVKQVARELGVRYVLEGSVRKGGQKVRITGQLIDATTGAHLWADRFDGVLADVFELQDKVAIGVVSAIEPRLRSAEVERAKRKPVANLDAYDLYLRALQPFYSATKQGMAAALDLLYRAIDLNPAYAAACGRAAMLYPWRSTQGWATSQEKEKAEAIRLARMAVAIDRDDPEAMYLAGTTLVFYATDVDLGLNVIDRSISMNVNCAHAWMHSGQARVYIGDNEKAIEHLNRALRLSPRDPLLYFILMFLANAHMFCGRFDQAIEIALLSIAEHPGIASIYRTLAACYIHLGRIAEARRAAEKSREITPDFSIGAAIKRGHASFQSPHAAIFIDGMRKAGVPE